MSDCQSENRDSATRANVPAHLHGRTLQFPRGVVELAYRGHDEASVVSLSIAFRAGERCDPALLTASLEKLACDIERRGGIVGHVKAFASRGSMSIRISIVDAAHPAYVQGTVNGRIDDATHLDAAVIALAIGLDALVDSVCDAMSDMLG